MYVIIDLNKLIEVTMLFRLGIAYNTLTKEKVDLIKLGYYLFVLGHISTPLHPNSIGPIHYTMFLVISSNYTKLFSKVTEGEQNRG
jgi:hypothetical protein